MMDDYTLQQLAIGYRLPIDVIRQAVASIGVVTEGEKIERVVPLKTGGAFLLNSLNDYITGERIYIIMLDEYIDVDWYLANAAVEIPIKKEGLEVCYLSREGFDFDTWVKGVKTKPYYLIGSRYKQIKWEVGPVDCPIMRFAEENKCRKYPHFSYSMLLACMKNICQVDLDNSFSLHGYIERDGQPQYLLATAIFNGMLKGQPTSYCPFVDHTHDEGLMKYYKPIMVAQAERIKRWANELTTSTIDFGMVYPHKRFMNYQTRWISGVDSEAYNNSEFLR